MSTPLVEKIWGFRTTNTSAVMIWYLLYPFRGTTEPPILQPNHPLRRTFTRYGREASRHPVITLLISVALAVILIYPFPYLYTNNFTNGSSNLPHHVWTAAQPYDGDANAIPDVVMRTVWVHGSYMDALNRSTLLSALEIQDQLLGPTIEFNPRIVPKQPDLDPHASILTREERDSLHAVNGIGDDAWFFHSPLLYWSGSAQAIADDKDIVATVNAGSTKATSVNVTLRHSIVFSGKRFEDHRLVAADALVITLLHKLDSPVGRQWERQARKLSKLNRNWRVFPHDGNVLASQLYEFKFQPLSFQDDLLLGIAYALTVLYFMISLTKLRALKSRAGLTLTIIAQIAVSIMSSFTICAVFKIDLSRIPREAYPLVVLTIGLENMFRLINAVIVTSSSHSTSSRIGEALGQTGPVALAGVTQNLFLLWMLAKVVSPSVASFCVFAAIALTFDFCFLLTFFVAVLGVDVRRTELSDSLNRAGPDPKFGSLGREETQGRSWTEMLPFGRVPVSTRIAGTVVMVGFILIAQWHFFENEHPTRTLSRLLQLVLSDHKPPPMVAAPLSVDVNQARSPTQWLRLQDHETAREVIQVVKPGGHSYVARVYAPMVIVLEGANRNPTPKGIRPFLPAVYDFARHQSTPFFVTVIFVVAAVSLLMNYLLWGEDDVLEYDDEDDHSKDDSILGVKTLAQGHALDIAMIEASPSGVIVSVGLDRWIRVWDIRQHLKSHIIQTRALETNPFPLLAMTIDDTAKWVALLSASGKVLLWDISRRRWGPSSVVELDKRKPVLFNFRAIRPDTIASVILVRASGLMTEIVFSQDGLPESNNIQLCKSPLVIAKPFWDGALSTIGFPNIATASRRGCVHIASRGEDIWVSEDIDLCWPEEDNEVASVIPLPALRSFLAVRRYAVDLIDLQTRTILNTFGPLISHQSTLRCFHTTKRRQNNGPTGTVSFTMVYTARQSGDCVIRTFTPKKEGDFMCIGQKSNVPDGLTYCAWSDAVEQTHTVESPGQWEALPCGVVVGVRRRALQRPSSSASRTSSTDFSYATLRRRGSPSDRTPEVKEDEDIWETWMLSATGERITMPISDDENNPGGRHLFATSCGPMVRVGRRSVAIGLGNVIKVITVGNERFDGAHDSSDDMMASILSRRRKTLQARKKSSNSQ